MLEMFKYLIFTLLIVLLAYFVNTHFVSAVRTEFNSMGLTYVSDSLKWVEYAMSDALSYLVYFVIAAVLVMLYMLAVRVGMVK